MQGGGRARLRPNRSRPRAVGGRRFGGKQLKGSSPRESGWAREVVTTDRGNAPSFLNKKNHPSLVASLHRPAYRSTLLFGHTKFTSNLRVTAEWPYVADVRVTFYSLLLSGYARHTIGADNFGRYLNYTLINTLLYIFQSTCRSLRMRRENPSLGMRHQRNANANAHFSACLR